MVKIFHAIQKLNECLFIIGNEGKRHKGKYSTFYSKKNIYTKKGNAESLNAAVATGIILWKLTELLIRLFPSALKKKHVKLLPGTCAGIQHK